MSLLRAAAVAVVLVGSAGMAQAACLKANAADQVVEGRLASVRITNEAYKRTEHVTILQLRTPACLDGPDDFDKVENTLRVHVFATDAMLRKRIRGFVGRRCG